MGKGIYTYYKERLIEIGGSNKCLYLKSVSKKNAYDVGRIFEGRDDKVAELVDFLWSGKKYALTVIDKNEQTDIVRNITGNDGGFDYEAEGLNDSALKKRAKALSEDERRVIEAEVTKIKELKREIDELEAETGRYELYLGYPFVFGCIPQGSQKTLIKAPLLLFPIRIEIEDDHTVEIRPNEAEKIHINHALVYAYAQSKKLNIEQLDLEYDDLSSFKSVSDVVDYLRAARIRIDCQPSKNVFAYSKFKEPEGRAELSVRYAAVMGRFPLSNSIYNDYTALEKKNLTNDAVCELLRIGKVKKKKEKKKAKADTPASTYAVKMLDYAQSRVVQRVGECGNMVIYGPPGTGKSQTIVNIITDAICKHKRVLVVSQKKAALDVVYNRLGNLNERAMYITDESRERRFFYDRCITAHNKEMSADLSGVAELEREYAALEEKISREEKKLDTIFAALNTTRPFGLSLAKMYSSSENLTKSSTEYSIYLKMLEHPELMALNFAELDDALFGIRSMNLGEMYFKFMQDKEKNPLIDNMQADLDIRTLAEVKGQLEEISKAKKGLFNTAKYPYYRQVLTYYPMMKSEESVDSIVRMQRKLEYPGASIFKKAKLERSIKEQFLDTLDAIELFVKEYGCLLRVLTDDGYLSVIDNLLRGNTGYIKLVYDALDNYIAIRDFSTLLASLDENKLNILNFAYTECRGYSNYCDIIGKFLAIRIYHEVLKYEKMYERDLANIVDYNDIISKIEKLKEAELEVARKLAAGKNSIDYETMYEAAKNNKDYLYQISKKQKYWPIRRTMEIYGDFIISLFPCWLLSPENVSSLLPLTKNMFDIVIFDEASQVFIESTIPTIYRGKSIVVAGDDKQLRPSTTFMKRYLGADPESQDDLSVQAALEVDSLLDLAVARYDSANLTYHYRSRARELIDFSNAAFYSSGLGIAPNISKNPSDRPIERYKVAGKWIDRHNVEEARKVVSILAELFKTRKNNESIGIITFNSDQQSCINDELDLFAAQNPEFREELHRERRRVEDGEDTSLFIKNLENVQGDERDIIIFSIGYAENENGKVYTSFGSLSAEGGENRLNVAITRARSKIIVVTSIEPEQLRVDGAKNNGPKLLQKYLMYVRAISASDHEGASEILASIAPREPEDERRITSVVEVEEQIKEKLERLGYSVDTCLGDRSNRISLAIYDGKEDRYLLGIELDKDAFAGSDSSLERDVYKPMFHRERGWTVIRVWCRDWWLYPQKVIKTIVSAAEKNKKPEVNAKKAEKATKKPKKKKEAEE
ncbi:MAG: DUF4011 domain-containing protein [Clostridia bacterium]|nr:DUF4011 domain-containing protein [Clostridia bacterium]